MTSSADRILDAMFSRPPEQGSSLAFVARRGGEVIAERYGEHAETEYDRVVAVTAESTLPSWSMAKSITHAAVGLLVGDGRLDVDAPAPVGHWVGTSKGAITTLHLLEMRSGLRFVEDYVVQDHVVEDDVVEDDVGGAASNCIEMLFGGTDPSHAHYAASQPLIDAPGDVFSYSSGTTNIIARIIGDIVCGGPGGEPAQRQRAVTDFLRERLFEPVGMRSATPKFDDVGDFVGSSYVYATARDFARFGELYLHDGVTEHGKGERILPVGWSEHARTRSGHDDTSGLSYGRHWWLWPAFPGSFASHGFEGQFVVVLPDRDLVIAHLGTTPAAHNPGLLMWLARLAEQL